MKYATTYFGLAFLVCGCAEPSMAQQDSTHLDAGYLTLNKAFTQLITIKGTDLEKMPFTNLSDAIGAWLYGAYSNTTTLQYIVDGNPVADVNAYSIHDIDEVVLVENAAATLPTAPGQAELVLIRTKRGKGPEGICVTAQTGLVTGDGGGNPSTTGLFHNYYVGGYQNLSKVGFGLSANFVRNVWPFLGPKQDVVTPDNLQRWRLNGYFDWRPDTHNQIELTMNYTPQQKNDEVEYPGQSSAFLQKGQQHFVLPHLDWRGNWGKGWTNDLQGTYLHSTLEDEAATGSTGPQGSQVSLTSEVQKSYHLWFRDRLAFEAKAGAWTIEPSLNLSYEHFRDQVATINASGLPIGSLQTNILAYSSLSESYSELSSNFFLATPEVDISYKRVLDIAGGAMTHPGGSQSMTENGRQVYPFGSVTLDLLRLGNLGRDAAEEGKAPGANSLKIYGSVASRTEPSSNGYSLSTIDNPIAVFQSASFILTYDSTGYVGPPLQGYTPGKPPAYWTWAAGTSYEGWKGRLQADYFYERRASASVGIQTLSNGAFVIYYPGWHSTLHHADIRLKVLDEAGVSWRSGLNVTLLRSKLDGSGNVAVAELAAGDAAPNPWSWTGGWVNRLQVKDFSAGLDLLYHFGQTVSNIAKPVNSIATPNIYAGYRLRLPRRVILEVYAESAGTFKNKSSNLTDGTRYFTLGANLCL